jgi:Negative regulator of sigma F
MNPSGRPHGDELRSRILQAVRERPAATRRQVRRPRVAFIAAGLAAPIVGLIVAGGPLVGTRPWSLLLATSGGTVALACAAIGMAVGWSASLLDRARVWFVGTALAVPPLWFLWKVLWTVQFEGMARPGPLGLRCFGLTFAFALGPLVFLAAARRECDPTHPISRGAALGAAAGVYAAALVDLWCPVGDLRHVLLGHALPVALLGLLGLWVGHRLLAIRGE